MTPRGGRLRARGGGGRGACRAAVQMAVDHLEQRWFLAANPVILYNFDEGAGGTTADSSADGGTNNGTLTGDTLPEWRTDSPSPAGGSYLRFAGSGTFKGTGSRVDATDLLNPILGGTASLSYWIRTTQSGPPGAATWDSPAVTGAEQAGAGDDIFWGGLNDSGRSRSHAGDGGHSISANPINDGNWHHITITRNATTGVMRTFVDGVHSSSAASDTGQQGAPFRSIGALTVVSQNFATIEGYNYLGADLDRVEIYNVELTPLEVAQKDGTATTAPAAPVLTNQTTGPASIAFGIGPVADEVGFVVYRSTSPSGPFSEIASLNPDTATFRDRNITVGQAYSYKVVAFNAAGNSPDSAVLTVTPPATGTGMSAFYYADSYWNRPGGSAILAGPGASITTAVADVNYDWGNRTPIPPFTGATRTEQFSTLFAGRLLLPLGFDGTPSADTFSIKLVTNTDDDGYLFADGQIASQDPGGHGMRDADNSGGNGTVNAVTVTEGVPVDLVFLMAQGVGGSGAILKWENPLTSNREVIPETFLLTGQRAFSTNPAVDDDKPGTPSASMATSATVRIDYGDMSEEEIRYELLRSAGATFNPATAQVVAYGAINATIMTDNTVVPGTTYSYAVRAVNTAGSILSDPTTVTTDSVSNGLVGHYYSAQFWRLGSRSPVVIRAASNADYAEVVNNVDVNWGDASSPGSGIGLDFSTVYTGKVVIPDDGDATPGETFNVKFVSNTDDDGFLFVNGVLVSQDPGGHGGRDADSVSGGVNVVTIPVVEGQSYNLVFLQNDSGGGAEAHLKWDNPVSGTREAIPQANLTPVIGAPAAATGLAIDPLFLATTQAKIMWTDASTSEIRYEISRATVTGGVTGAFATIATLPINTTSYTDTTLTANTEYVFRVTAINYEGSASADLTVTTPVVDVPPAAPSGVVALPRAGGVVVTFTDNALTETQFAIERAPVTGGVPGTFAEIGRLAGSGPSTGGRFAYTDATAVAGTTYAYRVRSATGAGMLSDPSPSVNVTQAAQGGTGVAVRYYDNINFTGAPVASATGAPATADFGNNAPMAGVPADNFGGAFTGTIKAELTEKYTFYTASDDGVELAIVDPDTGAILLQGPAGGLDFRRGMPGSGFSDTVGSIDLVGGKSYLIAWRFLDTGGGAGYRVGWSSPSIPQEVLPSDLLVGTATLIAPTTLSGLAIGIERVTVTFLDNNVGETGYVVERASNPAGPFAQVGAPAGITTVGNVTFTDTDPALALNQTYYYRVRPVNGATNGPNSPVISLSTAVNGTPMTFNGSSTILPGPDNDPATGADNILRVTDNQNDQRGSAFTTQAQQIVQAGKGPGGVAGFTTSFIFSIPEKTGTPADGFAIVMQRVAPTALGGGGGAMGYGGIANSGAVKFDLYPDNRSQVGLFAGGTIDDSGADTGLQFASGHRFKVEIGYDDAAKSLAMTITDLDDVGAPVFATSYPADVPATVGGQYAFFGFTGATGGLNAEQQISNWLLNGTQVPFVVAPTVPPPAVTKVFVNGGTWSPNFRSQLGTLGLGDATGGFSLDLAATTPALPWTNINQISVKFDKDVAVQQSALFAHGVNTANLAISSFAYDPATFTATWTLAAPVANDKVLIGLSAAGVAAQADLTVHMAADGQYRVNILPGDTDRGGAVNALDLSRARNSQFTSTTVPTNANGFNYSVFYDVDGSGTINSLDVSNVRTRQFTSLPAGDPVPSEPVPSQPVAAAAVVVEEVVAGSGAAPTTTAAPVARAARVARLAPVAPVPVARAAPVAAKAKATVAVRPAPAARTVAARAPAASGAFGRSRIVRRDLFASDGNSVL